jgi:hypothetical protein
MSDIHIGLMTPYSWVNNAQEQYTAFKIHFCAYTVHDVTAHMKQGELWG